MRLFWCGYALPLFAEWVFQMPAEEWRSCQSMRRDVLVFGAFGPCGCNPSTFKGVLVIINGEDHVPIVHHPRMLIVGPGGIPVPYGAVEWINQNLSVYDGPITHSAVAYANSNCVKFRENMAAALAAIVPVHAFGTCTAHGKAIRVKGKGHWTSNAARFRGYAFVIAAEHGITENYVTEKPFVAAAAGAIPIYWGHSLIASYMNLDRILMWNATTPSRVATLLQGRLRTLRALPALNVTAFQNMRALLLQTLRGVRHYRAS